MVPVPFEPDKSIVADALDRIGKADAARAVRESISAPASRWHAAQQWLWQSGERQAALLLLDRLLCIRYAVDAFPHANEEQPVSWWNQRKANNVEE